MADAPRTPDAEAPEALLYGAFDPLHLGEPYREDRLTPDQRRQGLHHLRLQARDHLKADAQGLADQLQPNFSADFGKVSDLVGRWKDRTSKYLRNLFTAGALALFGPKDLDDEDHKALDAAHAGQVAFLDKFAGQVDAGEQKPDGSLPARAANYGASVWGAAQGLSLDRAKRAGYEEGRRKHEGPDLPCPDCRREIDKGWMPIDDLVPIGDTQCMNNCHCIHEFRMTPEARTNMSKLSQKDRDKLPPADFGDPARRLFPIVDQDDVDSAARLIGKAKDPGAVKAKVSEIAKRKGLSLPSAWEPKAAMSAGAKGPGLAVAAFDLGTPTAADGYVLYPNSKLFEAGDYPDKDYSMTPEELWAAAEQFSSPVPVDLEHMPTVLDGKLGEVREVRLGDDGRDLMGTVAIPAWLDALLEEGKRKVSCTWDRDSKTLTGLALVNKPRVADAALMAAFAAARPDEAPAVFAAAHKTPHGAMTLQSIHDQAASAGALCDPGNSQFTSSRERSAIQSVHDLAVKGGAKCSVMSGRSAFHSAEKHSSKGKRMSLKDTFKALFGKPEAAPSDEVAEAFLAELTAAAKAEPTKVETEGTATAASFADSPEAKAMAKQIADLKQANALAEIDKAAAAFADAEIRAERSLPSEREQLVADFGEAALDDLESPRKVTFSANGQASQGSRVDRLKARHAARPRTILTRDVLSGSDLPEGARVIFAAEDPKAEKKPSEERIKALLSKTHVGTAALKMKAGK